MLVGWRYRVAASLGVGVLAGAAVGIANLYPVQELFTTYVPLVWRLEPELLSGFDLVFVTFLTALVVVAALLPLFKPRPRRKLDTIFFAQKRIIVAIFALATLGYFNYTYRVPRPTLGLIGGILLLTVPMWFVWINTRPGDDDGRAVLIGDDPQQFEELLQETAIPCIGHVCPSNIMAAQPQEQTLPDGGVPLNRLGGLSNIDDVLVERDIDTAVLAFSTPDRGDFFGTLDTCYEHGVDVKVHRQFADTVLTDGEGGDMLVDVDIEPWDPQDYVFKRLFDVVFSGFGLLILSPIMAIIAIAIKLDDGGPVFYSQERTAGFGGSFKVHKFRTMTPASESPNPAADRDRITRVGGIFRRTHLDEIPQLLSILLGRMSVVGPRAVWIEEEDLIEAGVDADRWRQRWFVKPGLTGLAQINEIGSEEPELKLRYDLEYIRRQSITFDTKIVIRQVWKALCELHSGSSS